jgi:hypothetical protein
VIVEAAFRGTELFSDSPEGCTSDNFLINFCATFVCTNTTFFH